MYINKNIYKYVNILKTGVYIYTYMCFLVRSSGKSLHAGTQQCKIPACPQRQVSGPSS